MSAFGQNSFLYLATGLTATLSLAYLAGCAEGTCHHPRNPELASRAGMVAPASTLNSVGPAAAITPKPEVSNAKSTATQSLVANTDSAKNSQPSDNSAQSKTAPNQESTARVFVSKPDGGLQCGQGKATSPEDMKAQLKGIEVFSAATRGDGKMHIQICGTPTGMLNVYEIPLSALSEASKRGFKKWEPRTQ